MFGENFRRKYALTYQGVQNVKKGTFWTVVVNIVVMGGISILYLLMNYLVSLLIKNQAEMNVLVIIGLLIAFVCLSFITHLQQYTSTYGLVYGEVKATRISLAEKLRQLPLGYFHKKRYCRFNGNTNGRCKPNGTCLVTCSWLFVWFLYFNRDYCCVLIYL